VELILRSNTTSNSGLLMEMLMNHCITQEAGNFDHLAIELYGLSWSLLPRNTKCRSHCARHEGKGGNGDTAPLVLNLSNKRR